MAMAEKAACLPGPFNTQGSSADKPLNSGELTSVLHGRKTQMQNRKRLNRLHNVD